MRRLRDVAAGVETPGRTRARRKISGWRSCVSRTRVEIGLCIGVDDGLMLGLGGPITFRCWLCRCGWCGVGSGGGGLAVGCGHRSVNIDRYRFGQRDFAA